LRVRQHDSLAIATNAAGGVDQVARADIVALASLIRASGIARQRTRAVAGSTASTSGIIA
jgi:hypothetical protein